jgi:hypothetical protein
LPSTSTGHSIFAAGTAGETGKTGKYFGAAPFSFLTAERRRALLHFRFLKREKLRLRRS